MKEIGTQEKIIQKKKKPTLAYLIFFAAAIVLFAICAILIASYVMQGNKEEQAYAQIRGSVAIEENSQSGSGSSQPEKATVKLRSGFDLQDGTYYYDPSFTDEYQTVAHKDIKLLQKTYPGLGAWLYIPGANISYPVMDAKSEEYLTTNYKGESAKSGSLFFYQSEFADTENKNLTIYGHNMKNGSMFGSLKAYLLVDDMPLGANKIYLDTANADYVYEIFTVYISPADGSQSTGYFSSEADYISFLQKCAEKSICSFTENPSFSSQDKVLTLSTCTSLNGAGETDRLILQARLIQTNSPAEKT